MQAKSSRKPRFAQWLRCAPAVLTVACAVAQAQYKIVGPDGKVTYTDRAPTSNEGKITALGARGTSTVPEVALPLELRQVVTRYPVTLFVTGSTCEPCNLGRQLLRQRGVPFTEKVVATPEDGNALERLSGGRDAPTLILGAQILRGLSGELWNSYLDAAGYPRESRLPANYQYPAPTPLTERREAAVARPTPPVAAPVESAPASAAPSPEGVSIKF